jgi:hypothetical protein
MIPAKARTIWVLIAIPIFIGCAARTESPNTVRVALLDAQTHKRIAENVRYSILTTPLFTTRPTPTSTRTRMLFERREVRGINEQGHTLPIDLAPGAWLIIEHPDYLTVIIDHDGDDAFIRMGSRGQLQLQDMVELPPLPDPQHSRLKSDKVRLKPGHLLIVQVERAAD